MERTKIYYETLTKCCDILEKNVQKDLEQIPMTNSDESNDIHFQEILKSLSRMKVEIDNIRIHDAQITNNKSKIDKNYIKKQVETFQRISSDFQVQRREHKTVRKTENSLQHLEVWGKMMDDKDNVKKRQQKSARKKKKIRSSTYDLILDDNKDDKSVLATLESIEESLANQTFIAEDLETCAEDKNEIKIQDSKPRIVEVMKKDKLKPKIVDVVYKKTVTSPQNEHDCKTK